MARSLHSLVGKERKRKKVMCDWREQRWAVVGFWSTTRGKRNTFPGFSARYPSAFTDMLLFWPCCMWLREKTSSSLFLSRGPSIGERSATYCINGYKNRKFVAGQICLKTEAFLFQTMLSSLGVSNFPSIARYGKSGNFREMLVSGIGKFGKSSLAF